MIAVVREEQIFRLFTLGCGNFLKQLLIALCVQRYAVGGNRADPAIVTMRLEKAGHRYSRGEGSTSISADRGQHHQLFIDGLSVLRAIRLEDHPAGQESANEFTTLARHIEALPMDLLRTRSETNPRDENYRTTAVLYLIAVVELAPNLLSGTVTRNITDSDFDVPTTAALVGDDTLCLGLNREAVTAHGLPGGQYRVAEGSSSRRGRKRSI